MDLLVAQVGGRSRKRAGREKKKEKKKNCLEEREEEDDVGKTLAQERERERERIQRDGKQPPWVFM